MSPVELRKTSTGSDITNGKNGHEVIHFDPSSAYSPMDMHCDLYDTTPTASRPHSPVEFCSFDTTLKEKILSRDQSLVAFTLVKFCAQTSVIVSLLAFVS
jgi:hypothetical protein